MPKKGDTLTDEKRQEAAENGHLGGRPLAQDERVAAARAQARLRRENALARSAEVKARKDEGLVIELEEARRQIAAMAAGVRRALDLAPSYLPADLQPEARAAAEYAMDQAINRALHELTRATLLREDYHAAN